VIVAKKASPAVFETLGSKCIRVTSLTFWGHSRHHLIISYRSFPIGDPLEPSLYL